MYKRSELKLKVHGYQDLAAAVIRQWKTDGMPRSDLGGVRLWNEYMNAHESMMHRSPIRTGSLDNVRRRRK
jgi:polyphosphate kinase 2 (PPK2 family)